MHFSFKIVLASVLALGCFAIADASSAISPAEQPDSKIVTTGMNDIVFSSYKIKPDLEDFVVTSLSVAVANSKNAIDPSLSRNVRAIEIFYEDSKGEKQKAVAPLDATGVAKFNDLKIYAPRRETTKFEIGADVNTVSAGAISGAELKIGLQPNSKITAVGQSSGSTITASAPQISNVNAMTLRKTRPVVSKSELSTGLTNGSRRMFSLNVVADASGDVAIKKIGFTVSGNLGASGQLDGWQLYDGGSRLSEVACTPDGNFSGNGIGGKVWAEWEGSNEGNVSAGSEKTFVLKASISGVTNQNQLSTFIESDDQLSPNTGNYDTISATGSNFVWSDESGLPHSRSSIDWTNGYLVEDFPLEPHTLRN